MQRRRIAERDRSVLTAPPGRMGYPSASVTARAEPVRGKTAPEPIRNSPYDDKKTIWKTKTPNVLNLSEKRAVTRHVNDKRSETKQSNNRREEIFVEKQLNKNKDKGNCRDEIEVVAEENKPKPLTLPNIANKQAEEAARPQSVVSFSEKPTKIIYTAVVHASHKDELDDEKPKPQNDEGDAEEEEDENSDFGEEKEKIEKNTKKTKSRKVSTASSKKVKSAKSKKRPIPKPKKIEKKKEPEEVLLPPSSPTKSLIIRTPTANSMIRLRQAVVRSAIKRETLTPSRVSITTEDRNAFVMRQVLTANSQIYRRSAMKAKLPLSQRINDFYEKVDRMRREVDVAASWVPTPKKTKNLTTRYSLRSGGLAAALALNNDDNE